MKKNSFKIVFGLLFCLLFFTGCTSKSDIKNSYCGVHINYQYCKCAFHNEHCGAVGMNPGEAKKYVYDKYDKWKKGDNNEFKKNCEEKNGFVTGNTCVRCGQDEIALNNKCVPEDEESQEDEDGQCRYDSDCDPICEGDVAWKMGCNPRKNICEKTFDNDCYADVETFGELNFPKTCGEGVCVSDTDAIDIAKVDLLAKKKLWSDTVKGINAVRPGINQAMLDANKNCLNGIADMTNLAIVEFATRVASVLAGGIPDVAAIGASAASSASGLIGDHIKNLASAAVDYAGYSLEKLKAYQQGIPKDEDKKLKPHEYIKLNCDLYDYFKGVQAESDEDLQTALDNASDADTAFRALP